MSLKQRSVSARVRPDDGLHDELPEPDGADPAGGAVSQVGHDQLGRVLGDGHRPRRSSTSYKLTFGASLAAAAVNAVFGLIVAWALVRYSFPRQAARRRDGGSAVRHADGRFGHRPGGALFVATAGSAGGWPRWGSRWPTAGWGVTVALTFIGLPFVVRTLQPALEDMDLEIEEAAASLGATRLADLPPHHLADDPAGAADRLRAGLRPGAGRVRLGRLHLQQVGEGRADADLHEAGAVSITPRRRRSPWSTLVASFAVLLFINLLQWWSRRYAA